jgi:N-acetylmuramoyl-L-alanine amidase
MRKPTNLFSIMALAATCAVVSIAAVRAQSEALPGRNNTGDSGIFVAYPSNGAEITAATTFVAGAVTPGSKLTINGQPVKLNKQGFFSQVVAVPLGDSKLVLQRNDDPASSREINVHRAPPPQPLPRDPLQIKQTSLEPHQDMNVAVGDLVKFAMQASPGGQGSVKLGNRIIALQAGGKSGETNRGLDTSAGITYQRATKSSDDFYTGFFRVQAADNWTGEAPIFQLTRDGATVEATGTARISVLSQPFLTTTAHDNTVVRTGPDASRTTPWPQGVRVLVDGTIGQWWRCEMASGKHLWIDKADLTGDQGAGSPPGSTVRTINIENDAGGGGRVTIPLTEKLPFEIKQEISPANRLQLTIYGATADTDWITEPGTASTQGARQGKAFPPPADRNKNPVSFITWQQSSDQAFRCTVNLNCKQQWGFWPEYEGSRLVLHINGAPHLAPGSMKGLRICVDPGHGGAEGGAIGCSGIREKTINLAIGKCLAAALAARGAKVTMTRTSDVDVSLADRVKMAVQANCQLLVSVHCNSLPDGRDPMMEHGTSSYYYHPQSLKLAGDLRRCAVSSLKYPDFHTRWQNLALCRPSHMPAALVEVGFVINPDEYASLISPSGQRKAGEGIAAGVQAFLDEGLRTASSTSKRRRK